MSGALFDAPEGGGVPAAPQIAENPDRIAVLRYLRNGQWQAYASGSGLRARAVLDLLALGCVEERAGDEGGVELRATVIGRRELGRWES